MEDTKNWDILSAEAHEQLCKEKDAELAKILKLRMVLKHLQKVRISQLALPDDGEQVERALKVQSVCEYLLLNEEHNDCLLNLEELRTVSLSYTERKALRQQLAITLRTNMQPIVDLGRKMRIELPEIFFTSPIALSPTVAGKDATVPASLALSAQLLALETHRRDNLQKLLELRNSKCAYLKTAIELKMGPYLEQDLDLLYAEAKLSQVKANVLRRYFMKELVSSTGHALKALKEVEGYVDEALQQLDNDNISD